MDEVCKPCQRSASDLKLTNKKPSDKKKHLVEAFSKKSITLLDNKPRVMLISALWW